MRCAHWRRVPLDLAREKQDAGGVDRAVQCQLSPHEDDEHYGLLADAGAYGTALWLRWTERAEAEPTTLPDCPVTSAGLNREGCCLFEGHPEQHTWEDTRMGGLI